MTTTTIEYVVRITNCFNYREPSGYQKELNEYIDYRTPTNVSTHLLDAYENVVLCTGSSLEHQLLCASFGMFECVNLYEFVKMFDYQLEVDFSHVMCDKWVTTTIHIETDMPERHIEYLKPLIQTSLEVEQGFSMFTSSIGLEAVGFCKRKKGSDKCKHPLYDRGQVVVTGNSIYQLCVCKECNESFMKLLEIQK